MVDIAHNVQCAVLLTDAKSGGLKNEGDPSNGSESGLIQTLIPGNQIAGFKWGTGKAGLFTTEAPFVLNPHEMIQVADGRSRTTGMIAASIGSTKVIALRFASLKRKPRTVVPAETMAHVTEKK